MVSLVPSATETLVAWGVTPIGVTRWCEHPEIAQIGGTKDPDIDTIVGMRPSLVVMDEEENRREDAASLLSAGLTVHALAVRSVADVAAQMGSLASRVGAEARWEAPSVPKSSTAPRRVFVPIWRQAVRSTSPRSFTTLSDDTYGSTLLGAVGLQNVYSGAAERYPTTTLDEAHSLQPDVVLAPSEPYKFTRRHLAELQTVAPVVFVDGKDLFWWGVRTTGAIERLSRIVTG